MELDYVRLTDIKPVLAGYIKESMDMLNRSPLPDNNTIHDIRVMMKKARAVINLVTPQVEGPFLERDLLAFREVGRIMCSWRETSVHRKTLKELKKDYRDIFSELKDSERVSSLMEKKGVPVESEDDMRKGVEQIKELLNKASYRIRFQPMDSIDPQLLLRDLESTYKRAVRLYIISRNNPKPDNFHEFRKRLKELLYQLFFFRPLNPSVVKRLEKRLDAMTQNLGKYNDLTQLVKALEYKYRDKDNSPVMDELIIKIREKQDGCLSKVWPAAYKMFCPGQNLVNLLGFKLLVI
jgi:CHAD domain-containing protein